MSRTTIAALFGMLFLSDVQGADEASTKPTAARQQYQALVDAYEQEGGARLFSKRFLEVAASHPRDPTSVDALLWVVKNVRGRPDTATALELLANHYTDSEKLGPACSAISRSRSIAAEMLLRTLLEKSPHPAVRAQACYSLGALLDVEVNVMDQLRAQPELAPRVLQYYGTDYGQHLASLAPAQLEKQREQVYELMRTSFPEVEIRSRTMQEHAEKMLFRIRHLSIGKPAPEIHSEDIFGKEFNLSDYRGRVVMLTFWGHW